MSDIFVFQTPPSGLSHWLLAHLAPVHCFLAYWLLLKGGSLYKPAVSQLVVQAEKDPNADRGGSRMISVITMKKCLRAGQPGKWLGVEQKTLDDGSGGQPG